MLGTLLVSGSSEAGLAWRQGAGAGLALALTLLWASTASAQWWFKPDKWAKPDGTKEELEADAAECKAEAEERPQAASAVFGLCMKDKGYSLQLNGD